MPQRLATITIERIGSKDLVRQKGTLIRILAQARRRSSYSARDDQRMEGLLNLLDTMTDYIKDRLPPNVRHGKENWEEEKELCEQEKATGAMK